jgi:hypothetical protein
MNDLHALQAVADYKLAWTIYLIAAAGWLLLQGWLTRRWQRETQLLLLGLVAILLLVSEPVPGHALRAPAVGFLLLAPLTGQLDQLAPILVKLSIAGIALVVLVAIEGIWRVRRQHRRQAGNAQRAARQRRRQRVGV